MNEILLTLGGLTLGGSAAVVLLALAGRTTWGRYGAKWRCWAWLLLCLRLAVPLPLALRLERPAPIQVDIPELPAVTQPVVPPAPSGNGGTSGGNVPGPSHSGGISPSGSGTPDAAAPSDGPDREERPADPGRTVALTLLAVWLLAAAGVLAWSGWAHLRFLSYLRRWSAPVTDGGAIRAFNDLGDRLGLHRRPRLLVCQGLKVPMLAGMLRPVVLLPSGELSGQELGLSLLHELTHYRRRDIWLKTLVMWVNALYWFDPLMWYMVRLVERDIELACDEDVLRSLSQSDYTAYGQTILDAVARLRNREG